MKTLHSLLAGLRPASLILTRCIAFPLLLFGAGLVLVQPCAGQGGTWTTTGSLHIARDFHTATLLPNGLVLVAGGQESGYNFIASAELYDPATGTWTATGSLGTARGAQTATLLPNGKVLAAGGSDIDFVALDSAELYDPATGTWTATGSLNTARGEFHQATLLPDGRVLVAGGDDGGGNEIAGAELYDPATGTWTATGSLATARTGHTGTLLPNGKVLAAGGQDGGGNEVFASAELYDPASGTWTETGSLGTARTGHTATLLPNGKVLVAGGFDSDFFYLGSAELYDPATGTWTTTGSLAARVVHTATLLPNGKVLVAGGQDGNWLASAELYDPASGTWTATGSLADARRHHTATLLPNGKVLAAAGQAVVWLASAELYTPPDGTNTCLPPPGGLVSWWSGDRTADDVQGTNNGRLLNGASFTRGMVGPGFLFDGINDGVTVPNSVSLSPERITVDAWVYITGNQNFFRHIISKDNALAGMREWGLSVDLQTFVPFVGLNTGFFAVGGATVAQLNTWYHVVMTHDGATLRLYVNGVLDGSVAAVGDIVPTSNPVGIGLNQAVSPFKGIIDEAQIFNRALTDAEILAIYQAGAAGQCKPDIFVASIDPSYTVAHSRYLVTTSVAIEDTNSLAISGATAKVKTFFPDGSVLVFPAQTDESGTASFSFYTRETGLYKFKMVGVSDPGRDYNPALNIETIDTLVIP